MFGKEKRKVSPSKEGKLGVEGVDVMLIEKALLRAGVTVSDDRERRKITASDLYEDGLCGREGSYEKRKRLLSFVNLPQRLSTKGFLSVLNSLYTFEEYKEMTKG
ncbi:Ribonuclease M5 [bioreactor metagenome]|uniref:Ribonuclease M5 n=1 Tax=bioreactor metagenome TaxID=1076179 RepID=A0A645GRJ9_9ZZZZ